MFCTNGNLVVFQCIVSARVCTVCVRACVCVCVCVSVSVSVRARARGRYLYVIVSQVLCYLCHKKIVSLTVGCVAGYDGNVKGG